MFDPVHLGHINCAEYSASLFNLDKVIFMPTANPPHKYSSSASGEQRYEMLKIATAGNRLFEVSKMELERGGTSYTIDTVEAVLKDNSGELFFILGIDAFGDICSWKKSDKLLKLSNFIVMARPGWEEGEIMAKLESGFNVDVPRFTKTTKSRWPAFQYEGSGFSIFFCSPFWLDISSSMVRKFLKRGDSVKKIVPEAVEQYIIDAGVYS